MLVPTQPTNLHGQIQAETGKIEIEYLLDSGSEINICAYPEFEKIQPRPLLQPASGTARAINGSKLRFDGTFEAMVELDGKIVPITLHVTKDVNTSILGIPALFEIQISPTPCGGFISLEKQRGVTPAFAAEAVTIPPYSVRHVKIATQEPNDRKDEQTKPIIALPKPSFLELPKVVAGIYESSNNMASVLMANPTQQQFRVNRKAFVAVIDELDEDTSKPWSPIKNDPPSDAKRTSWDDQDTKQNFYKFISNFNLHHISPTERKSLELLLLKKRKAFAKNIFQIGQFNHEDYSIPINQKAMP